MSGNIIKSTCNARVVVRIRRTLRSNHQVIAFRQRKFNKTAFKKTTSKDYSKNIKIYR